MVKRKNFMRKYVPNKGMENSSNFPVTALVWEIWRQSQAPYI